jgi:hypothetical protein
VYQRPPTLVGYRVDIKNWELGFQFVTDNSVVALLADSHKFQFGNVGVVLKYLKSETVVADFTFHFSFPFV